VPDAIRAMVFGDSITAGIGYQRAIVDAAARRGIVLELVGRSSVPTGLRHEGVNGRTATDAAAELPDALAAHTPDVLLVLLGANPDGGGLDAYEAALRRIVVRAWRFGVSVILGTVTAQPARQDAIDAQTARVVALVEELGGARLRLADLSAVDGSDLIDGVHPMPSGQRKIGEGFAEALDRWANGGRLLRGLVALGLAIGIPIAAAIHRRGWSWMRWPWRLR